MPGLDGYAVCRQIRQQRRYAALPIVMVTGRDDKIAINLAFEAGATDFISKPVSWPLLPHRLEYILRNAASVRELADRESKVRTLLEAIPDALWVVSSTGESLWSPNDAANLGETAEGRPSTPSFAISLPPDRLVDALNAIRLTARDGDPRKLEYRLDRQGALQSSFELRFTQCEGGDVLVVRQDTTERTTAAEHIEQLRYFDPLTGLPNRQQFIESSSRALTAAAAEGGGVALIYLDLNGFKRINDTFGHSVGDVVLKRWPRALLLELHHHAPKSAETSLARLGGDEFVFLVRDAAARDRAWTSRRPAVPRSTSPSPSTTWSS